MNNENLLKAKVEEALNKLGFDSYINLVEISLTKDKKFGDYSCNIAMKLASILKDNPRNIANLIINAIDKSDIDKLEIAGPGFINFFMSQNSFKKVVKDILDKGSHYGDGLKKNISINIEFVSANPTGYLHLGHARGAAVGDSLARILSKAGYDVCREYYVNDAGNQINNLGISVFLRYKELFGEKIILSDDMYHGQEIIEVAKILKNKYEDSLLHQDEKTVLELCKNEAKDILLKQIFDDLDLFNVKFDVVSFELDVRKNNAVEKEIENLKDHIYKQDGALVLKTSDYLDDKDRVIVKSNGDYTYFMPDIVYHLNKLGRGFDILIDVLGADHHGYINRMKSVLMMHGYSKDALEVQLIQMVRIFKDGEEIKLSKRTGQTITLRELCQEAGVDAIRYYFVNRSGGSHLDFDINLAREQSSSNPVFYAQYAYARLNKVLKLDNNKHQLDASVNNLNHDKEIELMKLLLEYPGVIENCALLREPYLMTNYIYKLANSIHSFYSECRIILEDDDKLTSSRLALAKAASIVIKDALNLIGVKALENM